MVLHDGINTDIAGIKEAVSNISPGPKERGMSPKTLPEQLQEMHPLSTLLSLKSKPKRSADDAFLYGAYRYSSLGYTGYGHGGYPYGGYAFSGYPYSHAAYY